VPKRVPGGRPTRIPSRTPRHDGLCQKRTFLARIPCAPPGALEAIPYRRPDRWTPAPPSHPSFRCGPPEQVFIFNRL
jgi:hypothetical protein